MTPFTQDCANLHGGRGLLMFVSDHREELKRLKLFPEDFR
jgi:hypothetical protein